MTFMICALSIIIVSWNTRELLRACLATIPLPRVGDEWEVLVVDNNSSDGSADMVRREFPSVSVIEARSNLGFARANNLALAQARGRHVLFLNSDTEIVDASTVSRLVAQLEINPSLGAVGPRLVLPMGGVQFVCARDFPTLWNQFCEAVFLSHVFRGSRLFSGIELFHWDHLDSRSVECLSGAALMVRGELVRTLGGFDDQFFMYSEDVDLCWRIKEEGYSVAYLADTEILHHAGGSSRKRGAEFFAAVMLRESRYRFFLKHRGTKVALLFRVIVALGALARLSAWVLFPEKGAKSFRVLAWSLGLSDTAKLKQ